MPKKEKLLCVLVESECSIGIKDHNMGGGRKNLKRAAEGEESIALQEGQSIMQVVELRGSNVIEVVDATGEKLLALFPAKFQKSMWIKRGSFVVVDASGRTEAVESSRKVACVVLRVLFYEQVRILQKHGDWPEIFRSASIESSNKDLPKTAPQLEDEASSSEDDGLPPLEANTNRMRPFGLRTYHDSDTDTES
ncbi:hypothetical protein Droror1_Dr00015876 [Drosera rotundifolia]